MKKGIFLLILMITVSFAFADDFTVDLTDDFGDGWNGGLLDVTVAGTLVLNDITLAAGAGPETYTFAVNDGDLVELDYVAGSWSEENAYYVYNNVGVLVASSGAGGVTPDAHVEFTAVVVSGTGGDTCAVAEAIGEVTDYPFDTSTATASGFGTFITSQDLWYVYTAPADGSIYVGLCDSSYDTKLAVYGACDPATLIASNDDSCGLQSDLDMPVVGGEDYFIQVGGYASSAGAGVLDVAFSIGGDTCGDAMVVGEVTDLPFDTSLATASGFGYVSTSPDLWYVFTPASDGLLYVGLCDTSFDTKLALYDDCVPTTTLGTNDDSCGMQSELIDIPVVSGEDYYIQVGGYGSYAGAGLLDVALTPSYVPEPPTNLFVTEAAFATWDAPSSGADALYSQLDFVSTEGGISSQDFETAYDGYDAEGADDFVVPAGETWTISEIAILGSFSVAGPCTLANVRFFADAAGMPGTLLFEYLNVPANFDVNGNFDCIIDDTILTGGTYWIGVQGRLDFAVAGQWFWSRQAAPTIDAEFHWQNPGDGFGSGYTTWVPGSTNWPAQNDYNLSFGLYGTIGVDEKIIAKPNMNRIDVSDNLLAAAEMDPRILKKGPQLTGAGYSSDSRALLGYNVYLDGVFDGFTTELFYQYAGLVNGTTYLAGVTALYDEGESAAVDYSFTYAAAAAYSLPFAEGFEGGTLPTDWTQEYVAGTTNWACQNGGYSGNPAAAHTGSFNAFFYNTGGATTKLITPQIDMGSATEVNLTFWHTQTTWAGDQDELRVYYKDSTAGTWTLLAEYLSSIASWTEETISLPNLSDDYYVAFEGLGSWGYGVCVDDVSVGDAPGDFVEIGDGTTYGPSPNQYLDWSNYWENCHTQTLYLASELGGPKTLTELSWNFERIAAAPDNWLANVVIMIQPTSVTAFTPGAYYDMTGATTVWSNANYVPATAVGWNDPIDIADFAYNGTDNLIIDILWGDNGYYESPYYRTYRTDSGVDRVLYGYADSETPPNYDGSSSWFSNMRFYYEAGGPPTPPAVIFSEYIEGSSNNKALEIWNNTGAVIDLADYRIAQSVNGGGWAYWHIFPTGATLADQDVWVMLNDATDPLLFDPLNADEVLAYPSVVHHNGDDARGLEWSPDGGTTWILIDVIGIPTEDPGDGWDVAGVTTATKDHTLYRKDAIMAGNTDWLVSAGTDPTDSEWIVYDVNTFTYLGQHPAASPFAAPENVMVDDATALVTWDAPQVIISEDNFDSYTSGDFLAVVNPTMWTTWSNAPGTGEDVVVSNAQSASPSNSVLVQTNNDCVMIMDNYTSGAYSLAMDMYVPTGYGGYFNLQKTSVPGTEWAFQIMLNDDGSAVADAGAAAALTFTYAHDTWMNMRLVVDLNTDWCDFYVDDALMIGYQWTLGTFGTPGLLQFGGMNIFGGGCTGTPMFYFDNVVLQELVPATDALIGYNVYLGGLMVGTTAATEYQLDTATLVSGNTYTAGVSAVYDDPGESTIIEDTFTYAPAVPGDTCGDAIVVAEVTDLPFDTTTATASGFGTYITSQDLWYVYTATGDGLLYVGLCGSSFDTKLALYGACDPTSVIATNDDSCGLQSELIDIAVIGGEDYFIQVGGYGTAAGAGFLDVAFTSSTVFDPPTNLFVDDLGYATWDAPGGTTPLGLYSQWDFVSTEGGITSQNFEAGMDTYDAEGADEFVVPTGETWTIGEVAILGAYGATSTGPCNLANVRFYADNAGMPGTLLFEYLDVAANPDVDGDLDCFIPDTVLPEGTYWIGFQGSMDYAPSGQWFWTKQAAPTIGSEFHWRNPGNGFAMGYTTWTTGSLPWPAPTYVDYNLSFALFGSQTDANGKTYVRTNPNQNTTEKMVAKAKDNSRNQSRTPTLTGMAYNNAASRTLTGYNVYLEGVFVAYTTDEFYQYLDLVGNTTYLSEVTAVYDDPGESVPIEYEFIYQPTTLDPPTDLFVTEQGYATWTAPGGGGANLFWNDFESDDGGLISNNAAGWQWGAPTSGPMAGYSGTNVWGTVLTGNYPTNSNFTLDTPTSYTIASADAMLSFWHWYDIEASYDGGNVKISTDGGTSWNVITPLTGYTGTANTSNPLSGQPVFCGHVQGFWELAEFDLSGYVGMDVMFRWHFGSDISVQYAGWYIDDVLLIGGGGGGSGTVQVDPMAVPYWTGTTTATALTQNSLVNGWDTEDGWMNFDVSGIPAGSTITEIQFNGYVNATYYPYWEINGVYVDPLTTAPATLFAAITNSANQYNYYAESSTFAPGWKVDLLGGTANADLAAALANDWFCLGINSTDNYPTYYIAFDGWNETNPPFLMVTYEGTDGTVATTKVNAVTGERSVTGERAVTSERAGATDNSREVLEGYNVYLDSGAGYVFEAYTTDIFYQHVTGGLTSGNDYTTAVEAVYDTGISAQIDYTWTYIAGGAPIITVNPMVINETLDPDEIVTVPMTISNTGTGDLTYDITVVLEAVERSTRSNVRRNTAAALDVTNADVDPDWKKVEGFPTDDLFDLQFAYPCAIATGEAGFETDGNYLYTTEWNGAGGFFRYNLDGTYVGTFVIPGAQFLRDLAYDGQYFYGAAANTSLRQMDFTPGAEALISTITAPVAVRAIAYDDDTNSFWANNWSDAITNFTLSGTVLGSFPCGTAISFYGFAYDNYSTGGPFLWGFSQSPVHTVVQFNIAAGLETGVTFDVGTLVTLVTGSSGGMFIAEGLVPGYVTLGCLVQNEWLIGLELCPGDEPWLSVAPQSGTVAPGGVANIVVTLDATDLANIVKTGQLTIANNAGADVIVPVTMTVTPGGEFDPPENVYVNDETGLMTWTPPAVTISADDFDSYTAGQYLAVQSPQWTTWSNAPGTGEDCFVSDAQSSSPSNSMLVELNNDLVYIMDDYTSGVYSMDIEMYVPTGYCGYYNMQKTSTPGQQWAFQAYFLTNGTTIIDAGAASAATFPYSHDEWLALRLVIDLDTDYCDFYFNGTHIIGYQWSMGTFGTPGLLQLGGMNIFGGANSGTTDTPMFYVDNVAFKEIVPATDELSGYDVYLDTAFISFTTNEFYQFTGLNVGQPYVGGVSAVYINPAGESIIVTDEFTYTPPPVLPPTNLVAVVQDYNE
ncbi:MAG: hypothetical protein Q7J16_08915, partial [Candidatus Cloacimonadales bacterium]|nr:hypothetical protein [Candidatus Cloacimonadales bacterium]